MGDLPHAHPHQDVPCLRRAWDSNPRSQFPVTTVFKTAGKSKGGLALTCDYCHRRPPWRYLRSTCGPHWLGPYETHPHSTTPRVIGCPSRIGLDRLASLIASAARRSALHSARTTTAHSRPNARQPQVAGMAALIPIPLAEPGRFTLRTVPSRFALAAPRSRLNHRSSSGIFARLP